jgi:hypothetical protein
MYQNTRVPEGSYKVCISKASIDLQISGVLVSRLQRFGARIIFVASSSYLKKQGHVMIRGIPNSHGN